MTGKTTTSKNRALRSLIAGLHPAVDTRGVDLHLNSIEKCRDIVSHVELAFDLVEAAVDRSHEHMSDTELGERVDKIDAIYTGRRSPDEIGAGRRRRGVRQTSRS